MIDSVLAEKLQRAYEQYPVFSHPDDAEEVLRRLFCDDKSTPHFWNRAPARVAALIEALNAEELNREQQHMAHVVLNHMKIFLKQDEQLSLVKALLLYAKKQEHPYQVLGQLSSIARICFPVKEPGAQSLKACFNTDDISFINTLAAEGHVSIQKSALEIKTHLEQIVMPA